MVPSICVVPTFEKFRPLEVLSLARSRCVSEPPHETECKAFVGDCRRCDTSKLCAIIFRRVGSFREWNELLGNQNGTNYLKLEWDKLREIRVGQTTWNQSGTNYLELEQNKLLLEIRVGKTTWNQSGKNQLEFEQDKLLLEIRVGQTGTSIWSGTMYYLKLEWGTLLLVIGLGQCPT